MPSDDVLKTIIEKLAEASPYALILVIGFALFYFMHRSSIKTIKELSETAIAEIRTSSRESLDNVKEYFLKISEKEKQGRKK